jgi:shikimate kinase
MDNRPPNPLTFNGSTRFLLPNTEQPPSSSTSTSSSSSSSYAVPLSQHRRSSTPGPAYTFPMPGQIPRSSASSPGPETRFRTASQLFSLRPRDIDDVKIAIFMVGLPARGKSYISQKMRRWLSWCGYPTRVFNVGNARREVSKIVAGDGDGEKHHQEKVKDEGRSDGGVPIPNAGRRGEAEGGEGGGQLGLVASSSLPTLETVGELGELTKGVELGVLGKTQSSNFFDPNDKEKSLLRDHLAMNVLEEMIEWLHSGFGCVGIHDATNTTIERREALLKRLETEPNIQVIFIESVCSNPEVLRRNIDLKTSSPDYKEMPKEEAKKDFEQRLKNYEKAYQPIPDEDKGTTLLYSLLFSSVLSPLFPSSNPFPH